MKKYGVYIILCAALLLAACGGPGAPASDSRSDSVPQASSSTPEATAPDSADGNSQTVPDSTASVPGNTQAADASKPETGGRTLSGEEMEVLWAKLEGKWLLADENAWNSGDNSFSCPVYDFLPLRTEEGYYTLMEYSAYGSGAMRWDFAEAREENNVYTLTAAQEAGEMSVYTCEPGSGTQFVLRFEGEALSIGWERPTCVWEEKELAAEPPVRYNVRLALPREEQRLAQDASGEGRLLLENGSLLVAGFRQEAVRVRKVTDHEIEQIQGIAPSDAAHVLTEEEKNALWQQLSGMWGMAEGAPEATGLDPLKETVRFERYENGQYALHTGPRESEYISYYVDTILEENGVYTFESNQAWGMMYCNDYEPGAGTIFRLSRGEDGTITLSARYPARYGQPTVILTEEGDEIGGCHWRRATPKEEQMERTDGADGVLEMENGDRILGNHSGGPTDYRLEAPQEGAG